MLPAANSRSRALRARILADGRIGPRATKRAGWEQGFNAGRIGLDRVKILFKGLDKD